MPMINDLDFSEPNMKKGDAFEQSQTYHLYKQMGKYKGLVYPD